MRSARRWPACAPMPGRAAFGRPQGPRPRPAASQSQRRADQHLDGADPASRPPRRRRPAGAIPPGQPRHPGRRRTLRTGAPGHRQGHRAVVAPGDRARDGHRPVAEGDGRQPGEQRPALHAGRGQVRVENRAQHAVLRVRDNGPGRPGRAAGDLHCRSPATSSGEGSGLGLPIVKRIVELHFGSIGLGKGLEGKGLEVQVFLPKTQPDATRPPARGPDSGRSHI